MRHAVDLEAPHPFGVQPSGNALFSKTPSCRGPGLGRLASLSDELLLSTLGCLDAAALTTLMRASKASYVFSNTDDLWRTLFLSTYGADWRQWAVDWRTTFVRRAMIDRDAQPASVSATSSAAAGASSSPSSAAGAPLPTQTWSYTPLKAHGLFSDLLYKPHLCAAANPATPAWVTFDNTPREDARALTVEEFTRKYERPNTPVVLTHCSSDWPALSKWSDAYLASAFGPNPVHCAGYDIPYSSYLSYIREASGQAQDAAQEGNEGNAGAGAGAAAAPPSPTSPTSPSTPHHCPREELPLYLFDKRFVAKAPALASDYSVPPYFADDLLAVLGRAEGDPWPLQPSDGAAAGAGAGAGGASSVAPPVRRPDYRWLIYGPRRSGSVFHKDPNGTSAWNAVIRGRKKWLLWPPHTPPPGVHASADGAEVATTMGVVEWFVDFYGPAAKVRDKMWREAAKAQAQGKGEVAGSDAGAGACAGAAASRSAIAPAVSGDGADGRQGKRSKAGPVAGAGARGSASLRRTAGLQQQQPHSSASGPSSGPANGWQHLDCPAHTGPYECVVGPGDVVFVPRGWWHAVLNLDDSLALTHNFVSLTGAPHALHFMRTMPYAISGLPSCEGRPAGMAGMVVAAQAQQDGALASRAGGSAGSAIQEQHNEDKEGKGDGDDDSPEGLPDRWLAALRRERPDTAAVVERAYAALVQGRHPWGEAEEGQGKSGSASAEAVPQAQAQAKPIPGPKRPTWAALVSTAGGAGASGAGTDTSRSSEGRGHEAAAGAGDGAPSSWAAPAGDPASSSSFSFSFGCGVEGEEGAGQ